MNRNVYLFELDSVKNSNAEILHGQKCLYDEIVNKGNNVIITMNQITDSEAFLWAIKNKKTYNDILSLFEMGYIKFSAYYDDVNGLIRTPSQYIQNSIKVNIANNNDSFIYSAIPVKANDTNLLIDVKKALKFSDISILKEKITLKNKQSTNSDLEYLIRYIEFILAISPLSQAQNPPKLHNKNTFMDFMNQILSLKDFSSFSNYEELEHAIQLLASIENEKLVDSVKNKRSNWLNALPSTEESSSKLAKIIINICYNYTVEDSIKDVSKHYTDATFFDDFKCRLEYELAVQKGHERKFKFPFWDTASRLMKEKKHSIHSILLGLYEKNYEEEKKQWNKKQFVTYAKQYCMYFLLMVSSVIIIKATMIVEDLMYGLDVSSTFIFFLTAAFWPLLCSFLYSRFKLPDIFETLTNTKTIFNDSVRYYSCRKEVSYRKKDEYEKNNHCD